MKRVDTLFLKQGIRYTASWKYGRFTYCAVRIEHRVSFTAGVKHGSKDKSCPVTAASTNLDIALSRSSSSTS